MQKLRLFFSIFFLLTSIIMIILIAIFDYALFFTAAKEISKHVWPAGIAIFLFVVLLSAGFVTHSAEYEGSIFSNGYVLLAILEFFLFAAGLTYYRFYTQQTGQIVLQLQPESIRDYITLGVKYQTSGSVLHDTVQAPGILENRDAGAYTFEILDEDIVYFRTQVDLKPASIETLLIPVALNVRELAVQTDPPGADIWINGVQASQTPDTFRIVPDDTVILDLKLSGYESYTDTILLQENVDLGIIPLQKLYTLWIASMYDYMEYRIYDVDDRVVFSGIGSGKCQLAKGRYRIAFEIGEGQYKSKTVSLDYNASVTIP